MQTEVCVPSAEGANLATGEARRISQAKGPCIRIRLWKVSRYRDTDGVKLVSLPVKSPLVF